MPGVAGVHRGRHRGRHVVAQGRGRAPLPVPQHLHLEPGRRGHAFERGLHVGRLDAREDAAVDRDGRRLRQGVLGVPAAQHRRHAGGPRDADHLGIAPQDLAGRLVGRIGREPGHRLADRARRHLGHRAEVAAGRVGDLHREAMRLQALQQARQVVDGVVGARRRAVPAGIGDRQLERRVGLLRGLQEVRDGLAGLVQLSTPAVVVEGELGIGQGAMLVHEAPRRQHAGLLVARERDDEIAGRHESLGLQPQERAGERGHAELVVRGAATEEVAVLLDQREGVALPVLATCVDHVHVREQQDRTLARGAVSPVSHHQARGLLARLHLEGQHVHVVRGESTLAELIGQVGGHLRHLALASRRADADDGPVDLERLALVRLGVRLAGLLRRRGREGGGHDDRADERRRSGLIAWCR